LNKLLVNLRYFMTPVMIFMAMGGIVLGGHWVWFGVVMFIAAILADWITSITPMRAAPAGTDRNGELNGIPWLLNAMMYAQLPMFILLQLSLAWRVYEYVAGVPIGSLQVLGAMQVFGVETPALTVQTGITGVQLIGATLSAGIYMGLGIMFGHELAHTKGPTFVISRWMMGLSGIAHFCYAHVYNHHLELGHEDDPATCPRGRNIYKHYLLSHFGQSRFLFLMEQKRLSRLRKFFISPQNRWIRGYLMALPTVFLFWWAGGWVGLGVMLAMWIISGFELEVLNFLEHYGLIREKGQPIEYRHSWDVGNSPVTQFGFIEIGRQGDHHDRGETHFWELEEVGSPDTGLGYYAMFSLLLIPPLWESFIKPHLAKWDAEMASEGERRIAQRMNEKAGWHDMEQLAAAV
jgi:alkane 1-monooxygenase